MVSAEDADWAGFVLRNGRSPAEGGLEEYAINDKILYNFIPESNCLTAPQDLQVVLWPKLLTEQKHVHSSFFAVTFAYDVLLFDFSMLVFIGGYALQDLHALLEWKLLVSHAQIQST